MSDDQPAKLALRVSSSPIEREDDWAVVPAGEAVSVSPHLGAMISVRRDAETARLVRGAAKRAGLTPAELVRRAAVDAARSVAARRSAMVAATTE